VVNVIRLNFVILIFTIILGLAVSTTLASNQSASASPVELLSDIGTSAVSGEFWRLGFTSEEVTNYNAVIGRVVSTVAAFQSNRGTTDIYYIFPAPTNSATVQSAYFYILERTGTYAAGNATLTLEVFNYAGVSQRILSSDIIDLQAATTGAWTPLALSTTGLTLTPGEFLAFHANFSNGSSGNLNVRPGFEVQLEPGTTPVLQGSYLPIILKNSLTLPDLVINNLTATSNSVTLTLRNQGNAPVTDAFWVDVYFNPSVTPSLNKRWQDIAPRGVVWGVTGAGLSQLTPGGTLTLTTGGPFYFPNFSSPSPWPVGASVFAQVDSINFSTAYGAVQESNEGNNVFGPVVSTAVDSPLTGETAETPSWQGLPGRE
jgi:hypothetical protein